MNTINSKPGTIKGFAKESRDIFWYCKGGVAGPDAPKMQALPEWWGGSDPCLDFCEGFVHMH